jgi:hypothetical protein
MTEAEAKEILLLHSFAHPNSLEDPRALNGFLGSLRPYRGHLVESNFQEIMEALRVLAPGLEKQPQLDRETISALWAICHLARAWGVHPDGMLRRNGLISENDVKTLETWIDTISEALFFVLSGSGIESALHDYNNRRQ